MKQGVQQKISRVRPPRVQITYDVEHGGATEQKTLPFVVGVVADLAPGGTMADKKLRERGFAELSVDNLDKVMNALAPTLSMSVPNQLGGESERMRVDLTFKGMSSFEPAQVALAVPELARLLDTRAKLNDLLAKLEGNDRLNDLLAEVVLNTELQQGGGASAEPRSS
ncbi:type VI secretion system contractile sheath small subunit [Variovorax saccharolyticus]|uniref:type VI secretion system contractile sheath small subunit n=1 Tax=Variovorax saccharolyticus TaxID=3053516 RepID=UPI0025777D61|nr:type VI secretion system contractile sheath small subunit [Variovorax sp. J31P216]MDM0029800.1 type VI secretion system contractile sheath small subunit [Variovorax sp. J31P216]